MARPGADSAAVARAMDRLGNVTVLERPTRVAALVSAARAALRARDRQYQIRDHLADKERAAEVLREQDRRKDEFLAVLAHELRNPLAPVRNGLQVLRMGGLPDPAAGRAVDMMDRQVGHMVRLVDDLLEVSRVTRGKVDLRRESVGLAAVVRAAVETSRPVVDAAGHELTVSLPPDPVTLDADPVRLAQVFANLLNNAAKYTDRGADQFDRGTRAGVRASGGREPPEGPPRRGGPPPQPPAP
ncbi:MAG: HAMP domain-containing histidine kinase, partial [Gemmataceae bacterium]|nr:HAMP domain-containing histidine kinase [Gemmataceae bacterium]